MSPEDDSENSIEASSATACHCVVLKAINKARYTYYIRYKSFLLQCIGVFCLKSTNMHLEVSLNNSKMCYSNNCYMQALKLATMLNVYLEQL